MSFLRFRPDEFRAISRACRPIRLTDDFFPLFQQFLSRWLRDAWPDLARRVASFRRTQLRLLYKHLRGLQHHEQSPGKDDARCGLTLEEFRMVSRACEASVANSRFVAVLRTFLVYHFRSNSLDLAKKLARMNDDQFARLYELLQERKRRSA